MTYDKDPQQKPSIFFAPEMEGMLSTIMSYHDWHADALGITRYAIPTQAELLTYYDSEGSFQIILETEEGYTLPDIIDIELLHSRIEAAQS